MIGIKENRLFRCKLAIDRGITYNPKTGKIFGSKGKEVNRTIQGYISVQMRFMGNRLPLYGHHLAWYIYYGEIVDYLDHINGIRTDNRICNLRSVNSQQNHFNNHKAKGYCYDKSRNKFLATIKVNGKSINLGRFNTEKEAREAYLKSKSTIHKIE